MEQQPPLTSDQWAAIGRRLDLQSQKGKLDLIIVALLAAEQMAEHWLPDPVLRKHVGVALTHALDARLKILTALETNGAVIDSDRRRHGSDR